jgi:hypothetical protein
MPTRCLPAEQGSQMLWPTVGAERPFGHSKQKLIFVTFEKLPVGHFSQRTLSLSFENLPGIQTLQRGAIISFAYHPPGQALHSSLAFLSM